MIIKITQKKIDEVTKEIKEIVGGLDEYDASELKFTLAYFGADQFNRGFAKAKKKEFKK